MKYDWVINFQACGDGGDTKIKGIVDFLGLTIYRSLSMDVRDQVKFSVNSG